MPKHQLLGERLQLSSALVRAQLWNTQSITGGREAELSEYNQLNEADWTNSSGTTSFMFLEMAGNSLAVQWLGLSAFIAVGPGFDPCSGN